MGNRTRRAREALKAAGCGAAALNRAAATAQTHLRCRRVPHLNLMPFAPQAGRVVPGAGRSVTESQRTSAATPRPRRFGTLHSGHD